MAGIAGQVCTTLWVHGISFVVVRNTLCETVEDIVKHIILEDETSFCDRSDQYKNS